MDSIRISKVENVSCSKGGETLAGTVHLTAHHLIFRYEDEKAKEMWVPYPLISLVTRLPQTLQGQCPVTFHTRTFETFSLSFSKESEAIDVFESVKELTVATSVFQLYAFFYTPNPPLPTSTGWSIYSPREEFGRMGVGTRTKAWRLTDINKDYSFSPTYPAKMLVPTRISDATLQYAARYRSKCRIPVLSYLHWSNYASITRSSQPMVGITQNRSIQDEKLIESIFQTHFSPESRATNTAVYGAQSTNLIIDARPTTNAMANTAKGAGTENMDHYKDAKKVYLGIDHIHAMRESLAKVVEALRDADSLLASINNDISGQLTGVSVLDRQALRRSGWLRHISIILEGVNLITRNIHVNSSHVLIHCSDGWDRTSQLSSLAQLCLDPFYRTIRGFEILIEKDWLSYGHKFLDRCGHLSSDKFFVAPSETGNSGGGAEAAQAFFASVQNRFTGQNHIKETSPVFHQFLESVRQIQRQFPERFEFNEHYLHQLYYHLYSCQFGTFLFNCEKDRRVGDGSSAPVTERTVSLWDFMNSPAEMEQNMNPLYDASLDDPANRNPKADMGVLFPNPKDVRFWHELYGRTDEEMNGRIVPLVRSSDLAGPVESIDDDPIIRADTPSAIPLPPSPSKSPSVTSGSLPQPGPAQDLAKDLSASAPELTALPSLPSPTESFRPYSGTSSSFSMKASSSTSSSPSLSPSPSGRPLGKAQDFFSGGGVRSVWGKLSLNASAAFSVVQEAYDGVTSRASTNPGFDKTEELRGRETLLDWGQEPQSSTRELTAREASSLRSSAGTDSRTSIVSNPWSTVKSKSPEPVASSFDNPWNSVRSSPSRRPQLTDPLAWTLGSSQSESSLPADPTVSHPSFIRKPSSDDEKGRADKQAQVLPAATSNTQSSFKDEDKSDTKDIDPLGVGF